MFEQQDHVLTKEAKMRRSIILAIATAAATVSLSGSASAQAIGFDYYVGPPASYYFAPGPYVDYEYVPDTYSYYAPGITVYRRRGVDPSPNNTGAFFRKLDREGRGGQSN